MFTAALFTTAKPWRQPACPLKDEWIKMRHINMIIFTFFRCGLFFRCGNYI